jgi:hypothetical protein
MLNDLHRESDFRSFVKKETNQIPAFMIEKVKRDLGEMWQWLPDKSMSYNQNVVSGSNPNL